MTVQTAKVRDRRTLRFESFDAIRDDVTALASVKVHTLGNWTFPQILEHLARSMDMAVDGADFKSSWAIRQLGKLLKKRVLSTPMEPGFVLPKHAASLVPDELPLDKALQHFRGSLKRLESETTRATHPVFGEMSLEECNQLQLRHAELHLSFVATAAEAAETPVKQTSFKSDSSGKQGSPKAA